MNPSWLEAFVALAETHSFRTAAARLNISAATLSDRVAALEEELGVVLLDRDASGSRLSERGEVYLPDAQRLLKEWTRISAQVRTLEEAPSTRLRMVVQGHLVPPPPLDDVLKNVLRRHYQMIPEMCEDREHGIEDGLQSGEVDIYFAFCPPTLSFPGVVHQTVYTTRLCALVHADHRLAKRESISLSELEGETLFLAPATKCPYLRVRELDALQAAGIRYNVIEGQFNPRMQDLLVSMGRGVAILPHSQCFTVAGVTAILPLTDPLCRCSMEMLYRQDNKNPALWQFLEEFGRTEDKGGEL